MALEVLGVEFVAVRGAEQPAPGLEAALGEGGEGAVVVFHAEDDAFFIAGKGRRIEDDAVEFPALFFEAPQPVKGIAFAKVMLCWVELVVGEIAFRPVEVRLRKIERGGLRAAESAKDGKHASVGEGVEYGISLLHTGTHALAVVALVEEDALGIAAVEGDLEVYAVFFSEKRLLDLRAVEMRGRFLLLLAKAFVIDAAFLLAQPGGHG